MWSIVESSSACFPWVRRSVHKPGRVPSPFRAFLAFVSPSYKRSGPPVALVLVHDEGLRTELSVCPPAFPACLVIHR